MVMNMMDDIKSHVKDYEDEEEIASYLSKILKKEAFDQKGLIYGMGHAVYSISDPRERVFKGFVEQLARDKGREKDMTLYNNKNSDQYNGVRKAPSYIRIKINFVEVKLRLTLYCISMK